MFQNSRVQTPAQHSTSSMTSANKLLHLSKTSLSSLRANQEMVLPQRVVGMSKREKIWKHLAPYLVMRCIECLVNDGSLSTEATPSQGSLPNFASSDPAPEFLCSGLTLPMPSPFL